MEFREEAVWKNIQQQDIRSFEHYYKIHYKRFFLLACKYMKDSAQAEEIVNDVFLKLWEDGYKIQIDSSLKSYIYKAIINRCINVLNKNKKESLYHFELENIPETGYELRQIEENELKVKLYTAIGQLPEQCRKVFEMSRFSELKQQEIADKLGISVKTVKNHITIALKHLSLALLDYSLVLVWVIKNIFQF